MKPIHQKQGSEVVAIQKNTLLDDGNDGKSSLDTQRVEDLEEQMRARAMDRPVLRIAIEKL